MRRSSSCVFGLKDEEKRRNRYIPLQNCSTVRHLKFSDPLFMVGLTLPYVVGGIVLMAFGAFADRVFRRTGSHHRSYVYLATALLLVSALCLYLAELHSWHLYVQTTNDEEGFSLEQQNKCTHSQRNPPRRIHP